MGTARMPGPLQSRRQRRTATDTSPASAALITRRGAAGAGGPADVALALETGRFQRWDSDYRRSECFCGRNFCSSDAANQPKQQHAHHRSTKKRTNAPLEPMGR